MSQAVKALESPTTSPLFQELDLEIGKHQSCSEKRLANTILSENPDCENIENVNVEKKSLENENSDEEKSSWLDLFLKGNETEEVGVSEAKDAASLEDGLIAEEDLLHVTAQFIESILGNEHQTANSSFQLDTDHHQPVSDVISAKQSSAEKEAETITEPQDTQRFEDGGTSGSILDEKLREEILAESLQPIVVVQQQQRVTPNNNVTAPVTSRASRRLSEVTNICLSILETASGERGFLKNHFPYDLERSNDDHDDHDDLEMSVSLEPDQDFVPLCVRDPDDPCNSNEEDDLFQNEPSSNEAGVVPVEALVEAENNDTTCQKSIEKNLEDFPNETCQEATSHQESEQQNPEISSSSKCQDPVCEGHGKSRGQKRKSFSSRETSPLSDTIPRKKIAAKSETLNSGRSSVAKQSHLKLQIPETTFGEVGNTLNCQSETVDSNIEKKALRRGMKRKKADTKEVGERPKRSRKNVSVKRVVESHGTTRSSQLSQIWNSKRIRVIHSQALESFSRSVTTKTMKLLRPVLKGYACTYCRFKTTLKKAYHKHVSEHRCHFGNSFTKINNNTIYNRVLRSTTLHVLVIFIHCNSFIPFHH